MRNTKAICINDGGTLQIHIKEIKKIPLLTFEEELALSKRIQKGDMTARDKLAEANMQLVLKIVQTYMVASYLIPDMIQEGYEGVLRAAEKYDHEKNARFATYASWWIRQFINRFLADKRRDIHLPHRKEECLRQIRKTEQVLSQIYMRQPTLEEIASEIDLPVEEIRLLLSRNSDSLSLEQEGGSAEEPTAILDTYEDYTYNPEQAFFQQYAQDSMMQILNSLKSREKWILMHRYQINGCERYSLRKLGDKMKVSTETVRLIEMKALQKFYSYAEALRKSLYTEAI